MDPLQALLMPVSDDEQMKALARSLRGRQTAAEFFSASSIPQLQQMAQTEQKYIQDVGERQGVLREALERRKQDKAQQDAFMAYRNEDLAFRKEDAERDYILKLAMAAAQGSNQKPPSGYMWNDPSDPAAGMTPIPGSPAEAELATAEAEKALAEEQMAGKQEAEQEMFENTAFALKRAKEAVTPYSTGLYGSIAEKFKRPDRMALINAIDTIKGNLSFDALKELKSTGATLGQVSNIEIGLLGATVAGLNPDMSDEDMMESLNYIEGKLKKWGFNSIDEFNAAVDQSNQANQDGDGWSIQEIPQ